MSNIGAITKLIRDANVQALADSKKCTRESIVNAVRYTEMMPYDFDLTKNWQRFKSLLTPEVVEELYAQHVLSDRGFVLLSALWLDSHQPPVYNDRDERSQMHTTILVALKRCYRERHPRPNDSPFAPDMPL